jgi:tetratricopeptide (TPR) repeat protein
MKSIFIKCKIDKVIVKIFFVLFLTFPLSVIGERIKKDEKLVLKGNEILNKGKYLRAIKLYSKAISINSQNLNAYIKRGYARILLKEYIKAVDDNNYVISLNDSFPEAYNNRAICKSYLNDIEGAIKDYNKAIFLSPNSSLYYLNRGICYDENIGDYLRAIEDYNITLQLDSLNYEAINNKGNCLLKMGDYQNAILLLSKSIELKPNFGLAYNNRGYCRLILGEYTLAILDFEYAEKYFPTYVYIYNNKANCYFKMNRLKEACINWNKAISMGYKYQPEWKQLYNIEDPATLIENYCK